MVNDYSEHGIYFTFIGSNYVDDDDLYDFCVNPLDPNALDCIEQGDPGGEDILPLLNTDQHFNAIDIYFLGPESGLLGAFAPSIPAKAIVYGAGVAETNAISHEMGHCLGLYHTFHGFVHSSGLPCESGPCSEPFNPIAPTCDCGDFISDTPADPCSGCYINNSCEYVQDPGCALPYYSGYQPPIENFMSYAHSQCRMEFTQGQERRMKFTMICGLAIVVESENPEMNIIKDLDLVYNGSFPDCLPTIEVQSGAKLTIQTDLEFGTDDGINILNGGRVDVDGGTLSGCGGAAWRGIDVAGNGNPQVPPVANGQGHLEMKNGAALVNAEFPIRADRGALVRATDSGFTDCGTVSFADYRKFSFSIFKNCNFTRSTSYTFSHNNQFQLENMANMFITGCTFQDLVPSNGHRALEAIDSKFNLDGGTRVEGYRTGVVAYSWFNSPYGNFSIKACNFKDNQIGVAAWGSNNPIVQNNTFEGIGQFPGASFHYGLALRHSPAFTVTGNVLKGVPGTPNTTGILISYAGGGSNEVKNNQYEGLEAANRAQGDNKGNQIGSGLQYLCNTNNALPGNTYDFLVFDEGIAGSQGGVLATDNVFSHSNSSFGDFNNQATSGIVYRHRTAQEETPLPGYYFNISPTPTVNGVDCSDAGGGEIPIPDDGDAKLTPAQEQSLVQVYQTALAGHTTLLGSYGSSLNGGQPEDALAAQVAAATSQTAAQLEQSLLSYSPYLTTGVLEAVVGRTDIYTDASIEAVLEANPDELSSPSFQAFLYGELPTALVDSVLTSQHQVTARTSDEASLTSYMMDMHRAANRIIKSVLADTTGIDFAKYRLWLDNKGNLEAAYEKVGSYLLEGDYASARSVRDSIPTTFDLQGNGLAEHTHFTNLLEIAITAMENSIPASGFDTARVAQVQAIADASNGLAASLAQGLLNFYYGYNYQLLPEAIGGGQQGLAAPPSGQFSTQTASGQPFVAMPNPARAQVTFQYGLEEAAPAILRVFGLDGRQVYSTGLDGKRGERSWDTGHLPQGVYYCHIVQAGHSYPPLKLVLIK